MEILKKMRLENIKQGISETVRDVRKVSKKHGLKGVIQYVSLHAGLLYDERRLEREQESTRRLRCVPVANAMNISTGEKYTEFGLRYVTNIEASILNLNQTSH